MKVKREIALPGKVLPIITISPKGSMVSALPQTQIGAAHSSPACLKSGNICDIFDLINRYFTVASGELFMKKLFLFPLWKVDQIEEELSKLEQSGWRLDKLSAFNCFHFVKSAEKNTSYFFTYKLLKENGMADIEHLLKSKYGANPVRGTPAASILHTVYVYRIASCADLEKPRIDRNIYLQHLVCQKILIGIFVPILCSLLLTFQLAGNGMPAEDIPQWIFLGIINLLLLAYCGYQIYGLCRLKQQYKKMLQHISYED